MHVIGKASVLQHAQSAGPLIGERLEVHHGPYSHQAHNEAYHARSISMGLDYQRRYSKYIYAQCTVVSHKTHITCEDRRYG
jgi:hypothetical protein